MSTPIRVIKNDDIWFKDISELYRVDRLVEFFPKIQQTQEERLNSIARLGLYGGVLLSLYKRDKRQILWGLFVLLFTYFIYKNEDKKESMTQIQAKPTLNNPFMNPTILDYGVPQEKKVPIYSTDTKNAENIREKIEQNFNHNLYKSIDDVYDTNNGRRQFYTVPNTDIPSDQDKYLEFLYGGMRKNCKSDTTQCEPYSDLRSNPFVFPNPKENPTVSK